jgi:hypothetical protein
MASSIEMSVVTASGKTTQRTGIIMIDANDPIGLVLPEPTAGAQADGGDDGKRLTILSLTPFAHELFAPQSGFNEQGLVGFFDAGSNGAPNGANITVFAYRGAWFVEATRNVTVKHPGVGPPAPPGA